MAQPITEIKKPLLSEEEEKQQKLEDLSEQELAHITVLDSESEDGSDDLLQSRLLTRWDAWNGTD